MKFLESMTQAEWDALSGAAQEEINALGQKIATLKSAADLFLLDDPNSIVGAQGGDLVVRIPSEAFGALRNAVEAFDREALE